MVYYINHPLKSQKEKLPGRVKAKRQFDDMSAAGSAAGDGLQGKRDDQDDGRGQTGVDELVPAVGLHDDESGIAVGTKLLNGHGFLLCDVTNNLATVHYTPLLPKSQDLEEENLLI